MKKISILLVFVTLLSACATTVNEFLGTQPTALPMTFTNTPTVAPTLTPTVPTPTFTSTPTMVGLKTKTVTPEFTPTPMLYAQTTVTPLDSSTPIELVTLVNMTGFVSVTVSDAEFYKGKECLPTTTKITAQVSDLARTAFVVLFVRFKSKQTGNTSEWTSIGMQPSGVPGFYFHDLIPDEMKGVESFKNAWVQYQIVATDPDSNQVGRTGIFDERLTLLECVVTPTPSPSVTPTVLIP